jgi:hypothetical protein
VTTTINRAKAVIDKWLPQFGFGHYTYNIRALPKGKRDEVWARCFWNHEDEELFVEVNAATEQKLDERELETVILHEFGHGLLDLAATSDHAVEVVCNRIPKLLLGKRHKHPNQRLVWDRDWDESTKVHPNTSSYMGVLVDGLSGEERRVIEGLFWDDATFEQLAVELGVSTRTVGRIRDEALEHLGPLVSELSDYLAEQAEEEYECESE